jgi:Bacterial Ig domain
VSRHLLAFFVGLALLAPTAAFGQVPPPGTWAELQGTRLGDAGILPNPNVEPWIRCGEADFADSTINSWVSAAYDEVRDRLVFPRTGGHGNSCLNAVVAWSVATQTWELLRAPSTAFPRYFGPSNPHTEASVYVYADGTPVSVHTYGHVVYIPTLDRVCTAGGIRFWDQRSDDRRWWCTDPSTGNWEDKGASRPGGYGGASVWDPLARRVWIRHSSGLSAYDPEGNTHVTVFNQAADISSQMSSLALDVDARFLYRIARHTNPPWHIQVADLSPAAPEVSIPTKGDTKIETVSGAGLFFDAGRLVGFGPSADGTRGAVYTLDTLNCQPDACIWMRHDPPNGITPPPPTLQGVWGRFFRANNGLYYVITRGHENVWVFNPPWRGGQVPPPQDGAPSVAVTSPPERATVTGVTLLDAFASDDVGVTSVEFLLDGVSLGPPLTAAPWSFEWDSTSVPIGIHEIQARAKDAAGHTTTSAVRLISVHNCAP